MIKVALLADRKMMWTRPVCCLNDYLAAINTLDLCVFLNSLFLEETALFSCALVALRIKISFFVSFVTFKLIVGRECRFYKLDSDNFVFLEAVLPR